MLISIFLLSLKCMLPYRYNTMVYVFNVFQLLMLCLFLGYSRYSSVVEHLTPMWQFDSPHFGPVFLLYFTVLLYCTVLNVSYCVGQ